MILLISFVLGLIVAGCADLMANSGRIWRFFVILLLTSMFIYVAYSMAVLRSRISELHAPTKTEGDGSPLKTN